MASTYSESPFSSLSSSSRHRWNYDVFLSFRGEDTRKNFTDHLYTALIQAGIHTFRDDNELPRGEEISPQLLMAIEGSRISIVVFSQYYASSRWCLDELLKILECRQTIDQVVLPIFYDTEPTDVRKQTGSYAFAFDEHEERFKEEMEKVNRWRGALAEAGNLSGWDLNNEANGYEAEFIKRIVSDVACKLGNKTLHVAKHPVGINSRVQGIISLLKGAKPDVGIVGIHGIAGIGKTTIAKAVFNKLYFGFEGSSFLSDVKEISDKPNGLVELQERLLHDILKPNVWKVSNVYEGMNLIKERLHRKKILVVFDDVDRREQLEALMGERCWFGAGSIIIVVTKNKHLLTEVGVDGMYHATELDGDQSLELFSLHAFRDTRPAKDYVELSDKVVNYCQGLPLALQILGSHLSIRDKAGWEIDIAHWQNIPHYDIQGNPPTGTARMTRTFPIHHPPLPTKPIPIHHSPLTTTARPDQHAHILSQSSTATLSSSKYPNHPVTFARNSAVTPAIPSASNTKSLDLSSHDTAPPIAHPIKLFFERFPSWVDYQDLKRTFFKFGRVTKLFLFKRKTALGRRFGFVDILSPISVTDLCDHASNLWFNTYKLRANPTKNHPFNPVLIPSKPLPKPAPPHKPELLFRDTRSFVEVLTSTKPQVVCDERRMVQYDSTDEDKEWLRRSLVGKILPNADVTTMEELVLKSIDKVVSFRFLGASQVIVTFEDQLASLKEQQNARSILYSLLSNLRQWEARICAYDRFAWISISGLPMEGWNRNCIDTLLQSWGNIIGYDTSWFSQGSISGIRVLIRTTKLEPLQGQVLLKLDGIQVEVILTEIKGKYIPSLTTVKHSIDVSLYTASVLSNDDEDDQGDALMRATSSHRTTGQRVEFEFDPIDALGNNTLIDSAFTEHVMPPMYLYPEITEPCK